MKVSFVILFGILMGQANIALAQFDPYLLQFDKLLNSKKIDFLDQAPGIYKSEDARHGYFLVVNKDDELFYSQCGGQPARTSSHKKILLCKIPQKGTIEVALGVPAHLRIEVIGWHFGASLTTDSFKSDVYFIISRVDSEKFLLQKLISEDYEIEFLEF